MKTKKEFIMTPSVSKIMIGDLLLVDGEVTKVTNENVNYVLNTLCQPIPLTKEFFEKIGWKLLRDDYFFDDDGFGEMHAHEFNDGMWQVEYENLEMGGIPTMSVNVCWIHEVCRFMDLCGVSKDVIY